MISYPATGFGLPKQHSTFCSKSGRLFVHRSPIKVLSAARLEHVVFPSGAHDDMVDCGYGQAGQHPGLGVGLSGVIGTSRDATGVAGSRPPRHSFDSSRSSSL